VETLVTRAAHAGIKARSRIHVAGTAMPPPGWSWRNCKPSPLRKQRFIGSGHAAPQAGDRPMAAGARDRCANRSWRTGPGFPYEKLGATTNRRRSRPRKRPDFYFEQGYRP